MFPIYKREIVRITALLSHSSDSVVFQNGPGAILTGFVASMRMIVNPGQGRIMPIESLDHT